MAFEIGTFVPLFFAAIGIGFFSSLLGLGGGVFMVPLLLLGGSEGEVGEQEVEVLFTGISASLAYYRRRAIDFRISLLFMPSALAGVFLGTYIVKVADPKQLRCRSGGEANHSDKQVVAPPGRLAAELRLHFLRCSTEKHHPRRIEEEDAERDRQPPGIGDLHDVG
ncbi:sulfite exporter TauE/SafE family protein, partial [Candidatus Bipolaricaulota bacterium]